MYLYFQQIEDLLQIIDRNQAVIYTDYTFVTQEDKNILLKYGVDFNKLYIKTGKTIFNPFNFGMLAESLREVEKSTCTYEELELFVKRGKYIPPTARDRNMIECLNNQSYKEIQVYPDFQLIKDEFIEGIREKKMPKQISSDIGHKTKNWWLEDILSYYHHVAWEQSTAMEIKKRNKGKDTLVYKFVNRGCGEDCAKLFLTNGLRSQPKLFRLSVLEANGSNIGKSKQYWKPTLLPVHYACTCLLFEEHEGFIWSTETQSFSIPDPDWKPTIVNRKKIRVLIGGKEFWV